MKKSLIAFSVALIASGVCYAKATRQDPAKMPVKAKVSAKAQDFCPTRGQSASVSLDEILNNNEAVVLDFWAPWCGPCKELLPVIAELSQEYPDIKFVKVNIDQYKEIASRYGVKAVPTVVYIKNGKKVKQETGFKGKGAIKRNLEALA